ncbi:von Willebrand factor C and EGF domain-containing protein-like [Rhincodon typus]|uniref:von Willebrand factor C and EGF domain-containing protein-like n=1 Tax=Rhincodon typus TaxID=259920 RepID=UPI00202F028F|nr:von Willebrand factor C and EGF domain-containing protein-like [Rhincodon typus]
MSSLLLVLGACITVCSFGCGNGYCIAPNLCFCRGRQEGNSCTDDGRSGHLLSDSLLNHSDIDGNPPSCLNMHCDQSCALIGGMPVCSCYGGYSLGKDGKTCFDVDECSRYGGQSLCQQICKNNIGSYRCLCYQGYQLLANGRTCITSKYLGLTGLPGHCGEYGCDMSCNHGGCEEISRVCPVGFAMIETSNGISCKDLDECAGNRSPCQQRCQNVVGSFQCSCRSGFYLQSNGHSCADINECRWIGESWVCHHSCHNTFGSYLCSCRAGFRLLSDRKTCEDWDECSNSSRRMCQQRCTNTIGSFFCSCDNGYSLGADNLSCVDIDECLSNPCSHHCVNTAGSFYCPCPEGFHLNVNDTCTENVPDSAPVMESLKQPVPAAIFATPWKPPTSCWHNGTLHQDGATWMVSECVECSCQEGEVLCQPIICESSCSHQVREEGQCCGTCDKCLYEGMVVNHEDVFSPSNDNCTLCVCISGNVKCITPECPPVTCEKPILLDCCPICPAECTDQDTVYPHGTEFTRPGADCIICVCLNGEVECSYSPCPVLDCARENWFLEPGQCCFTCRQDKSIKGCFIDDNGIEFPVGQIWSPGDPCEVCVCQEDGSIVCKRTECLETCAHPILVPGQCCPDCSAGCTYGGVTYQNNESFPSTSDSCLTCICLSGSAACSPMECKARCTYPFHSEGECCPLCIDCNYEGRKVTNGQSFQPENRPCYQCKCQFGEVSCDILTCESPSCERPYTVPGECCSTCSVCLYDGQVLEDGGYYISATDPCVVCLCTEGNVECDWKGDSCTELECEEPLLHIPGTCCPMCPDLSPENSVLYPPISGNMIPEKPAPTQLSRGPWRATVRPHPSGSEGRLLSVSPIASPTTRQRSLRRMLPWSVRSKLAQGFTASPERRRIATTEQPRVGHATEMDQSTSSMSQGHSVTQTEFPSPATAETISPDAAGFQSGIFQEALSCLFNGTNYTNGSQFIHHNKPCLQCQCSEGTVMCESQKEQCQALPCSLMQQETPVGQCCPVCVDSLCVYRDQVHEAQSQWLDGCNLCRCDNGTVECHAKPCSPLVSCPAQSIMSQPDGECCMRCVPKIRPKGVSCTVFGELHLVTFDGHFSNLNGTCAYLLAQDCGSNHFNVVFQSKWNDSPTEPEIKALIVQIENRTFKLSGKNQIRVNSTEVDLPYSDAAGITIQHSGIYVILNLLEGLSITWYGKGFVEINVPESLQLRICGLCGNLNGNSSDDFALPSGEEALAPVGFGNIQPIRVNKERLCRAEDIEDPCNGTTLADNRAANMTCGIIMGPLFQAAHESVDPQPYYQACLTDLCSCVEQTWCLCSLLSAYAFRALRNGIILNWRNETLCGVTCNGGSSYTECSCPQTCSTYLQPETECSTDSCVPGCQCPAGLFMYQSNCLPPSLCPVKSLYNQRGASSFPSL